ncbi:hypothetical protein NHF50_08235 [Flavobacterium sp. NRK F10]|uniref:Porin n=1 Tax=Flavobacterium sediminis TaxID=2201181 RepID=A0A2U8QUI3_9FLAO|nr:MULTISPECIES: hypothetical protein [Flavobacterium]AWM13857.1 hypothetical protein DI487_08290 [Flavobacterium sediminis]MCO6175034.1 hypothetical protein [Flavobacterium sp. NRK F10]
MKSIIKSAFIIALLSLCSSLEAQNRDLDNFRQPDKRGLNVFESPKDTASTFDNVKVRMGGSFALQYQAIDHENADGAADLIAITNNFNLATANLDMDVALAKGLRMHLRTYLSSRHHNEPYVKGGYFQVDNLDFVKEGLASDLMKYVTIKVGHMEINYGDTHFRRSDNAQAIFNPFVGNYIMDSFTTEVGGEVYFRKDGFLAMAAVTNTKLNQSVVSDETNGNASPSFVGKLGFDKQLSDDLRVRLTGSVYNTAWATRTYLYAGDRAGARYYMVMSAPDATAATDFRSGRYDPGFNNKLTAIMFNPFVKYQGLEFFGVLEFTNGRNLGETDRRKATQLGAELLYRFGGNENFYFGGRYNTVSAEDASGYDVDITRFNIGGGWFMTKNILAKVEYVNQKYDGFAPGNKLDGGKFNGFVAEAIISF